MYKNLLVLLIILLSSSFGYAQDTIRTYYDEDQTLLKELIPQSGGKAEGLMQVFDTDGKLIFKGFLKNNLRVGKFVELNPETGDTLRILPYRDGKLEGKSLSYYADGSIRQELYFQNDEIEGEVITFFPNGSIEDITYFSDGLPHGESKQYDTNGNLIQTSFYQRGVLDGTQKDFYPDGTLRRSANYSNGKLEGIELSYFQDGAIRSKIGFSEGDYEGLYAQYFLNGTPRKSGFYKKGMPSGLFQEFYESGSLRSEIFFKKGIPESSFVEYYESGEPYLVQEFEPRSDLVFTEMIYFKNGQLKSKTAFSKGRIHGEVKVYREDGTLAEQQIYRLGEPTGTWTYYDGAGTLIRSESKEKIKGRRIPL